MSAHTRGQVEQGIKNLLSEQLGVDAAFVAACDDATPLLGHGIGLDSIEVMALALGIEREFGIQIPDEELTLELFQDLATLTEYVLRKTR